MKARVISSIVALGILAGVLFFYETVVLNIAVGLIAVLAVYEVLLATHYIQKKLLAGLCLIFAGFLPFMGYSVAKTLMPAVCFFFILALFILMIATHNTIQIGQVGFAFFITLVISVSLTLLVFIRDQAFQPAAGIFYTILALSAAWASDTCAFFAGRMFGKRKLAPNISPKKTVEGAIGGVAGCMIFYLLFAWIFTMICDNMGMHFQINYLYLMLSAPIASVAGMIGDLSFSIIKRQCAVKDFGHIMPGHGGVLDRFDSAIFAVPTLYLFIHYFPFLIRS